MGRKGPKRAKELGGEGQAYSSTQPDPVAACVAVHGDRMVAVAVGQALRVLDLSAKASRIVEAPASAAGPCEGKGDGAGGASPFRSLAFSADGCYLAAAADDKAAGLRVWDTTSWECVHTIKVPKKVTCVVFAPGGGVLLAGDKFGDVQVAAMQGEGSAAADCEVLLGHYSSIITGMALAPGGDALATCDRDGRLRLTALPQTEQLQHGAHEIRAYCLGHTAFVTCAAFVGGDELLVSGGGDGCLRLWRAATGELLHTIQISSSSVAQQAQQQQEAADGDDQAAEVGPAAVLGVAVSSDGKQLAAIVDGRDDVFTAQVDLAAAALQSGRWSSLPGLHIPSQLCFDDSNRLWVAGGPPTEASTLIYLACGTPAADGGLQDALKALVPTEQHAALEGRGQAEVEAEGSGAPRRLLAAHLTRQGFTKEQLEHRKRNRRDKQDARNAAE